MARDFSKNLSNYLTIGTNVLNGPLSGASAVSLSAWVWLDTKDTGVNDNRIVLVFITPGVAGLALNVNGSTGSLRVAGRAAAADSLQAKDATTAVSTTGWTHVGGVLDFAAGTVTPYVNGSAEGGGAATFGATSYTPGTPTSPDSIGCIMASPSAVFNTASQIDGRIGEVAIWRAGLASGEMVGLAKGVPASRIRPGSLVAYFPLYGDGSSISRNLVAGTPTGAINGSVPGAAHPPIGAPFGGHDWIPYAISVAPPSSSFPYHLFHRRAV